MMHAAPDSTENDYRLSRAAEQVGSVFEGLLENDPEGLQALLAFWRVLGVPSASMDPADLSLALTRLPAATVLVQACYVGRADVIEAFQRTGVDPALLDDSDAAWETDNPEEWFAPQRLNEERGILAKLIASNGLPPTLPLVKLASLCGPRLRTVRLPLASPTVPWLAAALFFGRPDDAEDLWVQGAPWSTVEKAEAAVTWLGALRESDRWSKHPQVWAKWWDRLLADPATWTAEVPLKRGWARLVEPFSQLRAHDLRHHLEDSLQKAERHEPVGLLGVLVRALNLHGATSDQVMLRPVDWCLWALGRGAFERVSPECAARVAGLQAMDWTAIGPDTFGRSPAVALLDAVFQSQQKPDPGTAALLRTLVAALPSSQQDLWWSLARTAGSVGNPHLMAAAADTFRAHFAFEDHWPLFKSLQMEAEKKVGSQGGVEKSFAMIQEFWKEFGPILAVVSRPDAARRWAQLERDMERTIESIRPSDPRAAQAMQQMWLTHTLPDPAPSRPTPRM